MNLSRNSKCPCGSGKKFKHCCLKSDLEFEENEAGTIRRSVPISDDLGDQLGQHMEQLSDELGRDLTPEDELFPQQHSEHIEHGIVEAMKASGIDPAMIYAFEQTGLLVSEENRHLISDTDFAQWEAAVNKFHQEQETSLPEKLALDPSICWSCDKPLPAGAVRCLHCEARVEDGPKPEDAAAMMELLQGMDPEFMQQMQQIAQQCETGEEFVNMVMVGPCPKCESEDTGDCEDDPEIDDPCVGRCFACSQLFCCDCDVLFKNVVEATAHDCPMWEGIDEFDEDIPF